jgi:hypothetical protein
MNIFKISDSETVDLKYSQRNKNIVFKEAKYGKGFR